jgi:putative component of toxin-antitoxin plasmid stabilization module
MDYTCSMLEIIQSETFARWLGKLKDRQAVAKLVVLLAGGNKSTQDADIKRAIEIAKEWKD